MSVERDLCGEDFPAATITCHRDEGRDDMVHPLLRHSRRSLELTELREAL